MKPIVWTNDRRALRDLTPWEHNPRQIKDKQAKRLLESFNEFGQVLPIAIGPNNEIYDGHQRKSVIGAASQYGLDFEVDVRVSSRPLTERERQKLTVYLHKGAAGEWSFDDLANFFDMDDLLDWGFEANELGLDENEGEGEEREKMATVGTLYNGGEGHDVEPFKLAHRIEAIWQTAGVKAIDLFSGHGQLASWYRRRFDEVVTIDKNFQVGDVDYSMRAADFIKGELDAHMDFDYIDFDDEGCPADEVLLFFQRIKGKKTAPFHMALTDGNGVNFQVRGKFDFTRYLMEGGTRKITRQDYDELENYITFFVQSAAQQSGFSASQLSTYRGRQGRVVFQTWRVECHDSD